MYMCCCGCRNRVVTPVNPEAWELTFDGKAISLYPSIGNRDSRAGLTTGFAAIG